MASVFRQFALLLRKNGLLTRRKPIQTGIEALVPCVLPVVLLILRQFTKANVTHEPTFYKPFIIDNQLPPWLLPPGLLPPSMPNLPPLPKYWLLAYAPDQPIVEKIALDVSQRLGLMPLGYTYFYLSIYYSCHVETCNMLTEYLALMGIHTT
jgi:hypothetical protein